MTPDPDDANAPKRPWEAAVIRWRNTVKNITEAIVNDTSAGDVIANLDWVVSGDADADAATRIEELVRTIYETSVDDVQRAQHSATTGD